MRFENTIQEVVVVENSVILSIKVPELNFCQLKFQLKLLISGTLKSDEIDLASSSKDQDPHAVLKDTGLGSGIETGAVGTSGGIGEQRNASQDPCRCQRGKVQQATASPSSEALTDRFMALRRLMSCSSMRMAWRR